MKRENQLLRLILDDLKRWGFNVCQNNGETTAVLLNEKGKFVIEYNMRYCRGKISKFIFSYYNPDGSLSEQISRTWIGYDSDLIMKVQMREMIMKRIFMVDINK